MTGIVCIVRAKTGQHALITPNATVIVLRSMNVTRQGLDTGHSQTGRECKN